MCGSKGYDRKVRVERKEEKIGERATGFCSFSGGSVVA